MRDSINISATREVYPELLGWREEGYDFRNIERKGKVVAKLG